MTPAQIRNARATLGKQWGLDRPLRAAELARVLGLTGRDPGRSVLDWEDGKTRITGPVSLAMWYMLHCDLLPPTYDDAIRQP